jgi:hypothetical protein
MANYRLSFWTSTVAAAAITLALMALMLALAGWAWGRPGEVLSWAALLGVSIAVLVIAPFTAVLALVAAGGFIALGRDSLEAKGRPYVQPAPREATPSPLVALLRAVFGRSRFGLRPGDTVEIRSLDEILQTLDDKGTLNGLPFMPEMAAWCGTRARVLRRVDKLNDWIHGTGLKRMRGGLVLLGGLRCDGSAHGSCQSNCHLRWRSDWLRPADPSVPSIKSSERAAPTQSQIAALSAFSSRRNEGGTGTRYVCQATELTAGGTPIRKLDPRHYVRDFLTGNVRMKELCAGIAIELFNRAQWMRRAAVFPRYSVGTTTVSTHQTLDLQPGELVRVKPKNLIEPTLNSQSRNRGLYFDREMIRFCGGEYRVKTRAERIIIEKTGELRQVSNPCIILEGVIATGEYHSFNPENEYIFWREIWLERVMPVVAPSDGTAVSDDR